MSGLHTAMIRNGWTNIGQDHWQHVSGSEVWKDADGVWAWIDSFGNDGGSLTLHVAASIVQRIAGGETIDLREATTETDPETERRGDDLR